MAEIIIAKHRNGEVTDVPLRFIKEQAKFADADSSVTATALHNRDSYRQQETYDDFSSGSNQAMGISPDAMGGFSSGMMSGGGEFDIPTTPPTSDESPF